MNESDLKRFTAKYTVLENGCWQWIAAMKSNGYGVFSMGGRAGRDYYAHRLAYEHYIGRIPEGMQIDHLCRNRACVNPTHLEPVTMKENLLRGQGPTGTNARKTHCKYGHPFTAENAYIRPNGTRHCRKCMNKSATASHRKRRLAGQWTCLDQPEGVLPHFEGTLTINGERLTSV